MIRKVSALNADLVAQMLLGSEPAGKRAVAPEWSEEARAVMSVAYDQIESHPAAAAKLADQSLSLGLAEWTTFLERLDRRDSTEAEKTALNLLDRLADSPINVIVIRNLSRYCLAPTRSSMLREAFFQTLETRLRRDIRPDATVRDLEGDLRIAREMAGPPTIRSPRWQHEFAGIATSFESILNERSLPLPGPPRRVLLDTSTAQSAEPGDTGDIGEAIAKAESINDAKARDAEYQRLAARAALRVDVSLAEYILSKITDDNLRDLATVSVYGPLIRKAINDSDWVHAQRYALYVQEPLARTLALERVAQGMSRSGEDRVSVMAIYSVASARLDREPPSEQVAKCFLVLAKSLYPSESERGLELIRSCISVLNRLGNLDGVLGKSAVPSGAAAWVSLPNFSTNPEEVLDLPELVAATFKYLAKRDPSDAFQVALGLYNLGLRSLAQLAISRELFDQGTSSETAAPAEKKQAPRPANGRKPPDKRVGDNAEEIERRGLSLLQTVPVDQLQLL